MIKSETASGSTNESISSKMQTIYPFFLGKTTCQKEMQWYEETEIPYAQMPCDDRVWYPIMLGRIKK